MVLALGMLWMASLAGSALVLPPEPAPAPTAAPTPAQTSSPAPVGEIAPDPTMETVDIGTALVVTRGATCVDHDRLALQVRTWLDHPDVDARLRIEVVGDEEHSLRLSFTLRRGDEVIAVRSFDPAPERCTDLHAVVGLAIALAIDATVLESVGVEPRTVPPRIEPPTVRKTKPKPGVPQPRARQWRMRIDLTGMFTVGHPPGVGGGAKLELGFAWREILELGVGTLAASSGSEPVGDGAATFSVVGGLAQICAGPPWRRLRPRGCAGVIAGAAIAAGQGFMVDATRRVAWVDIPFGADLRVQLAPRVDFTLGIDGLVAVVRPVFEAISLDEEVVVRRFPRVGLAIEAGLSFLVW